LDTEQDFFAVDANPNHQLQEAQLGAPLARHLASSLEFLSCLTDQATQE
jgi:hypothetical protein